LEEIINEGACMPQNRKAFTIMEFLIVVIIISVIVAFGMPNYGKVGAKADERNMIANLQTLRAAVDMFVMDGDVLGNWNSLALINSNLRLSILDTKATYRCRTGGGETNACTATHPAGWALQFHDEHSNRLIHCSAGTCPTCPNQPGNCG
jgi:prepilin-type N-terminal cleavage/methylation domain-containing protein